MPGRTRRRYTTFLVATRTENGTGSVVYAAMAAGSEEAMAVVRAQAGTHAELAVVGSLSTRIAKTLKLKRGEVRTI